MLELTFAPPLGFGDILHAPNGNSRQIHLDQSFLDADLLRPINNAQGFAFQRATFSTGNMQSHFSRFRQEIALIASAPRILPIRTALIPRSLADRVGCCIQQRIQRILDRLPNQSVKMRPNFFFSDFNRSGDSLFIFLCYLFHGQFFFLLIAVWSL